MVSPMLFQGYECFMDSAISVFCPLVCLIEFRGLNHFAQPNDRLVKVLDGLMVCLMEPVTLGTLHMEILAQEGGRTGPSSRNDAPPVVDLVVSARDWASVQRSSCYSITSVGRDF